MKKVLLVATVVKTHIMVFHIPYLKMLKEQGYEVHVCARNDYDNKEDCIIPYCDKYYDLPFERSPFSFENISVYKELKSIIDKNQYEMIHCHTPVGGVLTRIAARKSRKKGAKILYTAHGFHFFKGAPALNWMIYYPIEKICSYFTDSLITINHEDYELAKKKMRSKNVYYIPGVGVSIGKYNNIVIDREKKREELGVPNNGIMILSVGELNKNKNHEVIMRALARLNNSNIRYFIAGKGEKRKDLEELAIELKINDKFKLLGYRSDIAELCKSADIFCFPSLREGLGLAALEAMTTGLPIVTSNVHGINDYSQNGVSGFACNPDAVDEFVEAIDKLIKEEGLRRKMGEYNKEFVKRFDEKIVNEKMRQIYEETLR